jgi:hypothetical protein
MSDMSHKFYIFSLESGGRLVRWSPLLTLSPKSPGFKPKQARKDKQKIKVLPGDKKSESNFSRIQSGINNRNFGPEFRA